MLSIRLKKEYEEKLSTVLIIDDEADIRGIISDILEDEGFLTHQAKNASQALDYLKSNKAPKAVILDIWLEGSDIDGIGLLKVIKSNHPNIPVIMISGHGNIEMAVKTIRLGAYDFIEKPFKGEKLVILLNRAIENSIITAQNNSLKQISNFNADIIGKSKSITSLKSAALLAAPTNSRIFITGEIGTGKGVLARMIHNNSKREKHNFVVLHAAASDKIESEIFGDSDKPGILEACDGGTLFIDEISDLPFFIQSKLLNFLQHASFQRLNSDINIKSDVRIIAASSKNMESEIESGNFSESLFYRLNVIPLHIAPLRDRKEDIKLIAEYSILQHSNSYGRKINITEDAYTTLCTYDWPGNVRELINTIEWLFIMSQNSSSEIFANNLPQAIVDAVQNKHSNLNPVTSEIISKKLKDARDLFEKEYILAQLSRFDNNISKTANFIGMDRTALHRKIKALDINIKLDE